MFNKLKRKSKQKRKRGESFLPYVAIFGLVVLAIVIAGGAYILTRPAQEACLEPGPECMAPTPSAIPYSLYPTVTPAMPPEVVAQQPQAPMIHDLALSPDEQFVLARVDYPNGDTLQDSIINVKYDRNGALQGILSNVPFSALDISTADSMVLHPDGQYYLIGSEDEQTVLFYRSNLADYRPTLVNEPEAQSRYEGFSDAAFSADGDYFALAGDAGGIDLVDARTLEVLSSRPSDSDVNIVDMAFTSDASFLVIAYSSNSNLDNVAFLHVVPIEDGQLGDTFGVAVAANITDIAVHPTLNHVAVAMPGMVDIVELDTVRQETYSMNHVPVISAIAYHPDGGSLAMGGSHDGVGGSWYQFALAAEGWPINSDMLEARGFVSGVVSSLRYDQQGDVLFIGTTNGAIFINFMVTNHTVSAFYVE